ncbi:MAG TPA: OmpA family protein [Anaeromyxobacteraceae bacterium]|nr:OmpA family protein [Anaeromyxobacteraceae bacterium]
MRRRLLPAVILAAGCAGAPPLPPVAPAGPHGVLRAAELARVKCLLVVPFENASDAPLAAEAATGALLGGIDPARARVFPIPELRGLFRDTALELPEGIPPSLALELGELLGADGALYGAVEGRSRGPEGSVLVTVRLTMVGERDLAFATTVDARPALGESLEGAVKRATLEAARPMLDRVGTPGRKPCFDKDRTAKLRALALSDAKGARAAPASPPPAAVARAAAPPPSAPPAAARPAAAALSPRQSEWAKRLTERGRILVDDVTFAPRSAEIARDAGFADLAGAIAAAEVKVRIEAFVDATSDPAGDARLSMSMAQAAEKRLVALGVARDRLSTAGRGGENPVLPNFTARGRAANRRIEVVGVR